MSQRRPLSTRSIFLTPRPMKHLVLALSLVTLLGSTGCSSTGSGPSAKSVNSAKTLTASEWMDFASTISDTISQAKVIDRYFAQNGGRPVMLGIGDFRNSVSRIAPENFKREKDVMYAAIRESLVNGTGGKVSVTMDAAGDGGKTDSLVQGSGQLRNDPEYDPTSTTKLGQAQAYQLVLTGQIVTIEYSEGRTDRYDYAVNVQLTDVSTRGTVFEKQAILPKTFTRGLFGR